MDCKFIVCGVNFDLEHYKKLHIRPAGLVLIEKGESIYVCLIFSPALNPHFSKAALTSIIIDLYLLLC